MYPLFPLPAGAASLVQCAAEADDGARCERPAALAVRIAALQGDRPDLLVHVCAGCWEAARACNRIPRLSPEAPVQRVYGH